jgi:hypothetical protein
MDGIIYLEDNNTKKKYVQIDLEKYGDLWPDFLDIIIANARKNDKKYRSRMFLNLIRKLLETEWPNTIKILRWD